MSSSVSKHSPQRREGAKVRRGILMYFFGTPGLSLCVSHRLYGRLWLTGRYLSIINFASIEVMNRKELNARLAIMSLQPCNKLILLPATSSRRDRLCMSFFDERPKQIHKVLTAQIPGDDLS